MRVVRQRSKGLQLLVWFGGLLLGPYSAFRLGIATAPDSEVVHVAAVLGFVAVFLGGTLLWMGWGVATVVLSGIGRLLRGKRPGPEGIGASETLVPRGYRSYVVLGVLVGLAVGLLAGLLTDLAATAAMGTWLSAGLAYGLLLWLAAHHGYLPFPEPE